MASTLGEQKREENKTETSAPSIADITLAIGTACEATKKEQIEAMREHIAELKAENKKLIRSLAKLPEGWISGSHLTKALEDSVFVAKLAEKLAESREGTPPLESQQKRPVNIQHLQR